MRAFFKSLEKYQETVKIYKHSMDLHDVKI